MVTNPRWPKTRTAWIENRVLHVSIPFTWDLPKVRAELKQRSMLWDTAVVGGPAIYLMPDFFQDMQHVFIGYDATGTLQRINPMATKTTIGCTRKCGFCAVPAIEGPFRELDNWPDRPIITDNNLLASSESHFDKVIDQLLLWGWADFNQGLDIRLLTDYHAIRIAEIRKPMVRLALDDVRHMEQWGEAFEKLKFFNYLKFLAKFVEFP